MRLLLTVLAAALVVCQLAFVQTAEAQGARRIAQRIARGETFWVALTGPRCPHDRGWSGHHSTDPLGTLQCRRTYRVRYVNNAWYVTGYNEGTRRVGTWAYRNANPLGHRLSLWGRIFRFDGYGRVYDQQYGFVGYIRMRGVRRPPHRPHTQPPARIRPGRPVYDSCRGIRGTRRPPLSAGSNALRAWLRCNRIR